MSNGKIRKYHSSAFKAKVALEAIKENKTVNELSAEYGVKTKQIYDWRDRLLKNITTIFADKRSEKSDKKEVENLHKIIGKLTVENNFLADVFNQLK